MIRWKRIQSGAHDVELSDVDAPQPRVRHWHCVRSKLRLDFTLINICAVTQAQTRPAHFASMSHAARFTT